MAYSQQYLDYLKSDTWKQRRLAALERAGFKCEVCGERDSLEVHHKYYDRLGYEDTRDLVVVCKLHHWTSDSSRQGKKTHKIGIPRKKAKYKKPKYPPGSNALVNWKEEYKPGVIQKSSRPVR